MGAALIPAALGTVGGAILGEQERSNTRAANKAIAEGNRFADVTGRFQGLQKQGGGALGGAFKGGFAGAQFGADNPSLFSGSGPAPSPVPTSGSQFSGLKAGFGGPQKFSGL